MTKVNSKSLVDRISGALPGGLLLLASLLSAQSIAQTWHSSASPVKLPNGVQMCTARVNASGSMLDFTLMKLPQTKAPVRMIGIMSTSVLKDLANAPDLGDSKVKLQSGETISIRFRKTRTGVVFRAPTMKAFYGSLALFKTTSAVVFPVGESAVTFPGYGDQDMRGILERCAKSI